MSQRNHPPWRNAERHYCACCNAWMGQDRQSIMIHENGKKHKDAMEASLQKRRDEKLQQEKQQNEIAKSLKLMEEAARKVHATDLTYGSFALNERSSLLTPSSAKLPPEVKVSLANFEKISWKERKEKRKSVDEKPAEQNSVVVMKKKKLDLGPNDGHYNIGDTVYLQGDTYAPIFEEDMPIEIWTGSPTTNVLFRQSSEASMYWKTGIILRVNKPNVPNDEIDNKDISCDVSYLQNLSDGDETIEKKVSSDRVRLIIGSDDLIPKTVEEARLFLLGEEVVHFNHGADVEIDENTGISSWGTVSVRKVTVSQQAREERARLKAKRLEELEKEKMKEKEEIKRRMEEAKHAGADDSALGAYDVWSTSGKSGYKGVNIHTESKVDVSDFAKSLSKGKGDVKFKSLSKSSFKNIKQKPQRIRSASDSE